MELIYNLIFTVKVLWFAGVISTIVMILLFVLLIKNKLRLNNLEIKINRMDKKLKRGNKK